MCRIVVPQAPRLTPDRLTMQPDDYCQQRAAASGSSFYYSFRFLDEERRRAVTALYAYCREVDDVVDDCSDPEVAAQTLVWWRNELESCFAGAPTHPVTQALAPHIARFDLPQELFVAILDGMVMDLTRHSYHSMEELQTYCYRVAGAVGLLAARIFGYTDDQTLIYAEKLGLAFQLTNIIRDVGQDIRMGRVYLPAELLDQHGIDHELLHRPTTAEPLKQALAALTGVAREAYREAKEHLPRCDRAAQRTGLLMSAIYERLLDEIERDGFQVLEHRVHLTPLRKLWIAWRTARREKRLTAN